VRAAARSYDAVVVGSGPNGLAAAITLARAGHSVLVLEAEATVGGGTRSAHLTAPGFLHDLCSSIHPLAAASPFFRTLPLERYGVEWVHAPAPLAHPLDDGTAVVLERPVDATADGLGPDARAYRRLMGPLVEGCERLLPDLLRPLRLPRHPVAVGRFGWHAFRSAHRLADQWFTGVRARGLFAGNAAHAILPLDALFTASFGLLLGMLGHAVGWPFPRGGTQRIADAMASYLASLGGEIVTGRPVRSLSDVPPARATLLDVTPRQLLGIAGDRLPAGYRRRLAGYRYGPGVFKLDFALDGPIPWTAAECARAATVHVGGTLEEIAAGEQAVANGAHPDRPFVLLAQPSLFDPTRAPAGKHTVWAYCHVPNGSTVDMTERIERQIERFAPGFRDRVLARSVIGPAELERHNANCVGGDVTGGSNDARQLFMRPTWGLVPYATPVTGLFICSASTPPGGGVHGMCGYLAARAAMRVLTP
jgi:phytoene dehydrogenase-like protein